MRIETDPSSAFKVYDMNGQAGIHAAACVGPALLFRGDAIRVLAEFPDNSLDAIITDPPYGCTDNPWDKKIDLNSFWTEVSRIAKPTAIVSICSQQPFTTDLINSRRGDWRYELIWAKSHPTGFLNSATRPLKSHESIQVFSRKWSGVTFNPQTTAGKPYAQLTGGVSSNWGRFKRVKTVNRGTRHPRSVLYFTSSRSKGQHPTAKPLSMGEWLVRSFTNPGDMVLDPFMGHGTFGTAAVGLGRKFIGVEMMVSYFNVALSRINDAYLEQQAQYSRGATGLNARESRAARG